jgi:hypothetical protein
MYFKVGFDSTLSTSLFQNFIVCREESLSLWVEKNCSYFREGIDRCLKEGSLSILRPVDITLNTALH